MGYWTISVGGIIKVSKGQFISLWAYSSGDNSWVAQGESGFSAYQINCKGSTAPAFKPQCFDAKLGAKNGVKAQGYKFCAVQTASNGGNYSSKMRSACSKLGMKPVCDNPSYCKTDKAALYIGQNAHLAYAPHRNNNGLFPSGWSAIRNKWNGFCAYTNRANGNHALCNDPSNTHAWKTPNTKYKFMCGKVTTVAPQCFNAK